MFKRRSSKDLSAKIGYDNVNVKPSKKLDPANPASTAPHPAFAPVSNVTASGHQKQASSSSISSYRKTSTLPSPNAPDGEAGGLGNISATGPPPISSVKALPPSGVHGSVPGAVVGSDALAAGAPPVKRSSRLLSSSSSAPKQPAEPPSKSLVIGEGVLFEGTTEGCAAAVVGGKLKGTVRSRRLEVTRAGRMEGTAIADTAEIAGSFEGTLTVTKALKICSTGRFKGEVSFGSIVVENGGKLEGKVNFGGCRPPIPESSAVPPLSGSSSITKKSIAPSAAPAPAPTVKAKEEEEVQEVQEEEGEEEAVEVPVAPASPSVETPATELLATAVEAEPSPPVQSPE